MHDLTARVAVENDDAAAATRRVASDVRPGEPEIFAQEIREQRARLDVAFVRRPLTVTAIFIVRPPTPRRSNALVKARRDEHARHRFFVFNRTAIVRGGIGQPFGFARRRRDQLLARLVADEQFLGGRDPHAPSRPARRSRRRPR